MDQAAEKPPQLLSKAQRDQLPTDIAARRSEILLVGAQTSHMPESTTQHPSNSCREPLKLCSALTLTLSGSPSHARRADLHGAVLQKLVHLSLLSTGQQLPGPVPNQFGRRILNIIPSAGMKLGYPYPQWRTSLVGCKNWLSASNQIRRFFSAPSRTTFTKISGWGNRNLLVNMNCLKNFQKYPSNFKFESPSI